MTTGFVEAARREKLKELMERGVAPFAYRFERTATGEALMAVALLCCRCPACIREWQAGRLHHNDARAAS